MTGAVGIVGGGIVGRVLATTLLNRGWKVSLFESAKASDQSGCSPTAAGMLAPIAELDSGDARIAVLGEQSLELWPRLLQGEEVFFERRGSLALALPPENEELNRLESRVHKLSPGSTIRVTRETLLALEPELDSRFSTGLHFPVEGQLDPRQCLGGLLAKIKSLQGEVRFSAQVEEIGRHSLIVAGEKLSFDWTVDCRGLSAKADLPLRGVRGELLLVESQEVHFSRPVRLMHRKHPLYVVPRPNGKFILGATVIESEALHPITVRSTLELLSMAYALHSGFSEARVLESRVQLRPAFSDNFPKVYFTRGRVRVNGMYRHGFLLSPAVAEEVANLLEGKSSPLAVEETL